MNKVIGSYLDRGNSDDRDLEMVVVMDAMRVLVHAITESDDKCGDLYKKYMRPWFADRMLVILEWLKGENKGVVSKLKAHSKNITRTNQSDWVSYSYVELYEVSLGWCNDGWRDERVVSWLDCLKSCQVARGRVFTGRGPRLLSSNIDRYGPLEGTVVEGPSVCGKNV